MRRWFGAALGCSGLAIAMTCASVLLAPSGEMAVVVPPVRHPATPPPRVETAPPSVEQPLVRPAAREPAAEPVVVTLDREQAIQFMQLVRDEGDPRSPPLGGLQPPQDATPEELADPKRYAAFEQGQTRELVQAYTSGVQQIPEIRARIEAAEQGGERSAEEIDEARAALEQLEMMRGKLERESPELLPDGNPPTPPAAP